MEEKTKSRRGFMKTATVGLTSGALSSSRAAGSPAGQHSAVRSPEQSGFVAEPARRTRVVGDVDVVVVGGGTAGVVAALASARSGASTVLIEQCGVLGGVPTVGRNLCMHATLFDRQHRATKKGFALEILDRLCKIGGTPYPSMEEGLSGRDTFPSYLPVDPEKLTLVEMNLVHEAGVKTMLHTVFCDALMRGSSVEGVVVQNRSGRLAVRAKVVIDASGEADVAASAGAPCLIAPKPVPKTDPFSNTWSVQMRLGGVDIKRLFELFLSLRNDPDPSNYVRWLEHQLGKRAEQINVEGPEWARQLLPENHGIQRLAQTQMWYKDVWEKNGFFTYLMLHHFRNYLRKAVENSDFRLTWPIPGGGHMCIYNDGFSAGPWGPDIALVHILRAENLSALAFEDVSQVEFACRNRVYEIEGFLKKYIPGFERSFVLDISPRAMSRNTRSIDGEFSLTDANTYSPKDDSIFLSGTGSNFGAYGEAFQVPYRIMLPRQVSNLLVAGQCASSAALQLHGNGIIGMMCMGHAAGTAAGLCATSRAKPRDIDIRTLQARLRAQGQILEL